MGLQRSLVVGLVSAVVIAVQVIFLRALAVTGYYHFAYLIISTALLGFGVSGTLLSLLERWLEDRFELLSFLSLVGFTVTTALSYGAVQSISPDMFYLLYSAAEVLKLVLEILLVALPFLCAGFFIGLVLSVYSRSVAGLYAWNQLGSGAGGVIGVLLLFLLPAPELPERLSLLGLLATALWVWGDRRGRAPAAAAGGAASPGPAGGAGGRPGGGPAAGGSAGGPAAVRATDSPVGGPANRRLTGGRVGGMRRGTAAILLAAAVAACGLSVVRPAFAPTTYDQYKDIARFKRLEQQGSADRVARRWGPRGQIDVYEARSLHGTLFASPTGPAPPEQLAILLDGNTAGTLFDIESPDRAAVLDTVPQSLAYRLLERPRVLLLGEVGAVNVLLAERFNAEHITVVQRNPQLVEMLQQQLADRGGEALNGRNVTVMTEDPRLYLERSEQRYDIIQFVGAEGLPAGSGGLGSLNQDYLLTAEGLTHAVARLSPRGLLTVTRGVHIPPRDNVRVLSTARAGLERFGVPEPDRHLIQARNYLAMTTLVSRAPLPPANTGAAGAGRTTGAAGGQADVAGSGDGPEQEGPPAAAPRAGRIPPRLQRHAEELLLDIEYYPGLQWGEREQRNVIPGPEDEPYSYYHYAATRILADSETKQDFFERWVYDVRPATDDKPYFHGYFRWSSIPRYLESYGTDWLRHVDLGYVVVVVTFGVVTVLAFLLVLLPILLRRRRAMPRRAEGRRAMPGRAAGRKTVGGQGIGDEATGGRREAGRTARPAERHPGSVLLTILHFAAIGFGFMFIEILLIQKLTNFMGDPLYSTAAVLTGILVFAGIGSGVGGRIAQDTGPSPAIRRLQVGGVLLVVIGGGYLAALDPALSHFVGLPVAGCFVVTLLALLPITTLLGIFFPLGVGLLRERDPGLVPLAWGVNGFASVSAAPLALLLSMAVGFRAVFAAALALYLLVAGLARAWRARA